MQHLLVAMIAHRSIEYGLVERHTVEHVTVGCEVIVREVETSS